MLKYKDYTARIELDTEAGVFHGRVLGIKDIITFEGETPKEVEKEFHKSIDAYLQFCVSIRQQHNQPDSCEVKIHPPAVQRLIDHPDFPDNFVATIQSSLKRKDPDTIANFAYDIEKLSIALELVKSYLNDGGLDTINQVVSKLNFLLLNPEVDYVDKPVPVEEDLEPSPIDQRTMHI
jgi:hypothetical protein